MKSCRNCKCWRVCKYAPDINFIDNLREKMNHLEVVISGICELYGSNCFYYSPKEGEENGKQTSTE